MGKGKETYTTPRMELVVFETEDIMTSSIVVPETAEEAPQNLNTTTAS